MTLADASIYASHFLWGEHEGQSIREAVAACKVALDPRCREAMRVRDNTRSRRSRLWRRIRRAYWQRWGRP